MSEKKDVMSTAVDWQNEISAIAGPFDGNRKGWLSRAARKAGTNYRQVKALYYGETNNPRHSVATNIISAADQARLEEARRDAIKLANIYQNAAIALDHIDADFHRHTIDALVEAARVFGCADRSGNNENGK